MENVEKLYENISNMILKEDVEPSASPIEMYNYWVQKSGVCVDNLALASRLLDFIEEALVNKNILSEFCKGGN